MKRSPSAKGPEGWQSPGEQNLKEDARNRQSPETETSGPFSPEPSHHQERHRAWWECQRHTLQNFQTNGVSISVHMPSQLDGKS